MMLKGKTVLLGVTGGIAAYKSAYLTSLLKKEGADIRVIMTRHAAEFVAPLTFESLSNAPVVTDMFRRETPWEIEHISLADQASLMVIAPATANVIAKLASGIADDMLTTTALAVTCPVIVVPAMNTHMYQNPATQENLETLKARGIHVMEADSGYLACGYVGAGRMKEPDEIVAYIKDILAPACDFSGKHVVVSAGPTREHIDAVRYLSNPSTGKMGYAIAKDAALRGAQVTLVTGPVELDAPEGVEIIKITSAAEMDEAVSSAFESADVLIMAAAVADYTPKDTVANKMKKAGDLNIELVRTTDILEKLGKAKGDRIVIGFAAETDNTEAYAKEKLNKKNLDMIALNDITEPDAGFGKATNHVYLFKKDGGKKELKIDTKEKIAQQILDEVKTLLK